VRDRQARLENLLVESPAAGLERARAIADEGARFNLGRSVRNFNVPTLVLAFLHPSVQPRFSFEWKGTTSIEGRSFVELAFRELAAPTVVRGPDSHPGVLAAGRVWVHDGKDGALGRTELVIDLTGDGVRTRATLTTEYRPHQALGLWVPVEMRDRLQTELVGVRGRSGSVELVEGLAAYTGFRKAGVSTQEEYRVPEPEPPGPGRPTASFPEPRPQGPRASMNMTHSAAAPIELPPLVSRLLQGRSNRHSTTGVRLPHGNRHPRARALAPRGRGRGDRRVARHSTRGARRP
jgi:hypothetical protein